MLLVSHNDLPVVMEQFWLKLNREKDHETKGEILPFSLKPYDFSPLLPESLIRLLLPQRSQPASALDSCRILTARLVLPKHLTHKPATYISFCWPTFSCGLGRYHLFGHGREWPGALQEVC